jgi:hypothetical protein
MEVTTVYPYGDRRGHETTAVAAGSVHAELTLRTGVDLKGMRLAGMARVTPITASPFRCHVRDPYMCVQPNLLACAP